MGVRAVSSLQLRSACCARYRMRCAEMEKMEKVVKVVGKMGEAKMVQVVVKMGAVLMGSSSVWAVVVVGGVFPCGSSRSMRMRRVWV